MTREEMGEELQRCLVSSPSFAPFCLPLLLDKAQSQWSVARIDALKCFVGGGCLGCLRRVFGLFEEGIWGVWVFLRMGGGKVFGRGFVGFSGV